MESDSDSADGMTRSELIRDNKRLKKEVSAYKAYQAAISSAEQHLPGGAPAGNNEGEQDEQQDEQGEQWSLVMIPGVPLPTGQAGLPPAIQVFRVEVLPEGAEERQFLFAPKDCLVLLQASGDFKSHIKLIANRLGKRRFKEHCTQNAAKVLSMRAAVQHETGVMQWGWGGRGDLRMVDFDGMVRMCLELLAKWQLAVPEAADGHAGEQAGGDGVAVAGEGAVDAAAAEVADGAGVEQQEEGLYADATARELKRLLLWLVDSTKVHVELGAWAAPLYASNIDDDE